MKNPISGNHVPQSILDTVNKRTKTTLTLKPEDGPYFSVRSIQNPTDSKIGFGRTGFAGDPFAPTNADFITLLTVNENGPTVKEEEEIEFLRLFGLIAIRDKTYYIHPRGVIFYSDKQDELDGYVNHLLKTYTLPGRYWRAYYSRLYLPKSIHLTHRLDLEMQQVEEDFLNISEIENPLPK